MADKTSFEAYQKSGFNPASGVSDLQEQSSQVPVSDDALRDQAIAQYADTLKTLDDSYSKQLSSIIATQANDEKLLNEQYNNSIASMAAQLKKRGLDVTASLPQAQAAALNKHMNDVMTVRQGLYNAQRSLPEQQKQLLVTDYDKAIAQRMAANRATNVPVLSELLSQIAELQNASYTDYINYLLSKRGGGGGGGSRRRSGSSGSSGAKSAGSNGFVNPSDLAGTAYKVVDIYAGGAARRQTNGGRNARKLTSTTQDGSKYSF